MIQVVCVKWGDKYAPSHVNGLYDAVRRNTGEDIAFTLVTDDTDGAGYRPAIRRTPFPDFGRRSERMKVGCRLKLAIFERGLLEPGTATVFLDLDTMIRGDVARLAGLLARRRGIYMMRNHLFPTWRFRTFMRLTGRYYFGNSSVLVFYPGDFPDLLSDFVRMVNDERLAPRRHLFTDERFISWYGGDRVRVIDPSLAVKFNDEFMARSPLMADLKARLPWVARRRSSAVAVTFAGDALQPRDIGGFREGQIVRYKGSVTRWRYPDISAYWRAFDAG